MKSPAVQFYFGDYLASQRVALLSLEEEGAYVRLLGYCWLHGSIPAEPEKLARLIGKGASTTLAATVATMFEAAGSVLIHPRLEAERKKQQQWRDKSAAGGRRSAETRREKGKSKQTGTTLPTKPEPPFKGSSPNGANQTATLHPSSSSFPPKGKDEGGELATTEEALAALAPLTTRARRSAGNRSGGDELILSGGPPP